MGGRAITSPPDLSTWEHKGHLDIDAERVALVREVLGEPADDRNLAPSILLDAGSPFYAGVAYPILREDLRGFTTVADQYELCRPLRVGERLRTVTRLVDVNERARGNGEILVLVRYEQRFDDGRGIVGRHDWTVAFLDGSTGPTRPIDTPAEEAIGEVHLYVDPPLLHRWSTAIGDRHPVHLDPDIAAREYGLDTVVAHASLEAGLLVRAAEAATGRRPWTGTVAARYLAGARPGRDLAARAYPARQSDGSISLVLTAGDDVVATGVAVPRG